MLLASGLIILRLVVRRDYRRRGRLSIITSFLEALLFFVYGGFPYLYVSEDWPAVHVHIFLYHRDTIRCCWFGYSVLWDV